MAASDARKRPVDSPQIRDGPCKLEPGANAHDRMACVHGCAPPTIAHANVSRASKRKARRTSSGTSSRRKPEIHCASAFVVVVITASP
jgi:hypothetical protein